MLRPLLCLLAAFGLALGLVALTFSPTARRRADFVFANAAEPQTLDPALGTGEPEGRIEDALFEGLTHLDPRSFAPAPGVASSWNVSDDGLVWTFHLRPEARWSDGRPVTAGDFAWSWRRLLDPDTASRYAYLLHPVRYAEAFHTYGACADLLLGGPAGGGGAARALEALARTSSAGLSAAAWRQFVRDARLPEALAGADDPRLVEALAWGAGTLEARRLEDLVPALRAEGRRRREAAREAARVFGVSAGVYARDDRTLVVELRAVTPGFLELTSFRSTYPVPRRVVEAPGRATDWFLPETIVSNGPFRLASWRVNDRIRLVRSETYWDRDRIRLGVVDAIPTDNAATQLGLYLTGELDWISGSYPHDLVDDLARRSDFYRCPGSACTSTGSTARGLRSTTRACARPCAWP